MKRNRLVIFLFVGLFLFLPENTVSGEETSRQILALYSSGIRAGADDTETHRLAEMPLNYIGFHVRYWNLDDGLPPEDVTQNSRGILLWGPDINPPNPEPYGEWLLACLRGEKPVAIIGSAGVLPEGQTEPASLLRLKRKIYREIGLDYRGEVEYVTRRLSVRNLDRDMMEFERSLPEELPFYTRVLAKEGTETFLTLEHEEYGESDAVTLHSNGGYVMPGYTCYNYRTSNNIEWIINPFSFFRAIFEPYNQPVPNLNLMNGHRIFISAIDGDGFRSISSVDGESFSGKVLHEEILTEYTQFPTSVSFIGADLDPEHYGNETFLDRARQLASLPHVEGASHTWAHPADWEARTFDYTDLEGYEYDLSMEINHSVSFLNEQVFHPVGKDIRLFLLSGNTRAPEEAFARLEELGIPAMNGGDTRLDRIHPSLTNVTAYARPAGTYRQPYNAAASEFLFTDGWTERHQAFRNVIKTWKNTDQNRLLKPVHLYYHFFTGDRQAGISTLHTLYRYLRKQKLTRIFQSKWANMVLDFHEAKIERVNKGYRLVNWGQIRTATFRNEKTYPDIQASTGVIGYRHRGGHTHIFLDDSDEHTVILSETPPDVPHVKGATGWIHSMASDGTLELEGTGKVEVTLAGLSSDAFLRIGDRRIESEETGTVSFDVLIDGHGSREVTLEKGENR